MIPDLLILAQAPLPPAEHAALGSTLNYVVWLTQAFMTGVSVFAAIGIKRALSPLTTRTEVASASTEELREVREESLRENAGIKLSVEKMETKLEQLRGELTRRDDTFRADQIQRDKGIHGRLNAVSERLAALEGSISRRKAP